MSSTEGPARRKAENADRAAVSTLGSVKLGLVITGRTSREITDDVERAVHDGTALPGDVLPSVRTLARSLRVSPATVAAAYRDLRTRGVLTSTTGKNTRVSPRPPLVSRTTPSAPAGTRDVSDGNPDPELLPSFAAVAGQLQLGQPRYGDSTLTPESIAMAMELFSQCGVSEEQVCLCSGAMDGVERLLFAWLRPGDRVLVEDPSHTAVLDVVRAAGLVPVPVALDEYGPVPKSLATALQERPAAFIVTPRAQNPTGAAIDEQRASALTEVLGQHPDVMLIENDHAGPVAGQPYVTLTTGRRYWAIVRSVSKWLGPDLRVAFVAGDRMTISKVEGRQRLGSGWVSHILQRFVTELNGDRDVARLIHRAETAYGERRDDFITMLRARGIGASGRSGLNVFIPVPEESTVIGALQSRGWSLRAGEPHRIASQPFVRVTTAALHRQDAEALADDLADAVSVDRARSNPA